MVFVLPKHLRRPFYRDRKLLTGLCRSAVVAQYDALTFLLLLALQVPPPGLHMVRYYGH